MKRTKYLTSGALIAFLILTLFSLNVKSQDEVNDNVISVGVGFGTPYDYTGTARPSFLVTYDRGFKEISNIGVISIGGIIAYQSLSYNRDIWDDYHANAMYFAARGLFHFTSLDIDKLDLYGGVTLGLRVYTVKYDWNDGTDDRKYSDSETDVYAGLFGGARYYLTDNFAVFSELLYDVSWIKLGVSFKF